MLQRYDALKRANACNGMSAVSLIAHLKKKMGTLRHVVVARVRNRPTLVLCPAVLGFPAPSSLETLHPYTEVQPHKIYLNPMNANLGFAKWCLQPEQVCSSRSPLESHVLFSTGLPKTDWAVAMLAVF